MSSATHVPETTHVADDLDLKDARAALRRSGTWPYVRDSYVRFRYGDGFTSSRALAFQLCLALVPLVIVLQGVTSLLPHGDLRRVLGDTLMHLSPTGQREHLLQQVMTHTTQTANAAGGVTALVLGLLTALVSLTTSFAQIERGANRIYGIQRDRTSVHRYGHAFVMAVTVGMLAGLSFALLVAGGPFGDVMRETGHWSATDHAIWTAARWPAGLLGAVVAIALVFHHSPRRSQPGRSWLVLGSTFAVVLWLAFTGLLALYVNKSGTFGSIYGPLTWVIALLLWAFLTSWAIFLGLAFAAQLEAVRAGVGLPALPKDETHDVVAYRVPVDELDPLRPVRTFSPSDPTPSDPTPFDPTPFDPTVPHSTLLGVPAPAGRGMELQ
jgi:YihY family inner membrane protein